MRRILIIVASAVAVFAIAAGVSFHFFGESAVREGRSEYFEHEFLRERSFRESATLPIVAWIGDSTLIPRRGIPPYSALVPRRLRESARVQTIRLAGNAFDAFSAYCMVGLLAEARPEVVFIVANLRVLALNSNDRPLLTMTSFIPTRELPKAALLPWHYRQISVPRLLLSRAYDWPGVEATFLFSEGLRQLFRDRIYSTRFKPSALERIAGIVRMQSNYHRPPTRPNLEMLRASVELAVRQGSRVLVMVTPIPVETLRSRGYYSQRTLENIGVIRGIVEAEGAGFLDLHDAVEADGFRDQSGHFNRRGAHHMADLLAPFIERELRASAG